jgi:hypothetical protein
MYLTSVSDLEMQTEEAEVRAASQGTLEARVHGYARQAAWAPPDVARDLETAALAERATRTQITEATERSDLDMASSAEALVSDLVEHREALAEIQSARDEWSAATADDQHQARMAATELANRSIEPEPVKGEPAPEPVADESGPDRATIDAQLEQASEAVERLHADREAAPETEPEQWAREMAAASTEPSMAWEAGHAVTEPGHQAEEVDAEL